MRPLLQAVAAACILLPLAGGLAACDTTGDEEGYFEADVFEANSGNAVRFRGRALFSTDEEDGTFTVEMIPRASGSAPQEGLFLGRAEAGLPATGRYAFHLPEGGTLPRQGFAATLEIDFGGLDPALYHATNGTLRVTTSSEERVEGEFYFNASIERSGGNVDAPRDLSVSGEFSAERSADLRFPS